MQTVICNAIDCEVKTVNTPGGAQRVRLTPPVAMGSGWERARFASPRAGAGAKQKKRC
jgi:hypothetical protein